MPRRVRIVATRRCSGPTAATAIAYARSDDRSVLRGLFRNAWLWSAVALSLALHAAVIYTPLLQEAFSTVALGAGDWLLCAAVASSVLWLSELRKLAAHLLWPPAATHSGLARAE